MGGSGLKRLPHKPKTIGIVGSRRRNSEQDFLLCREAFLSVFQEGDCLVSGGCPKGGDRFAEILAKGFGATITIHYPNWDKHGRFAGFVRNTSIAEDCDLLIAVVASDRTGGTEDTIRKAGSKRVILVEEKS